jgi:hypothetical protein
MRPNDRREGSLRMLLIFALLVANIIAALLHPRAEMRPAEKVVAPHAVSSSIENSSESRFAFAPPTRPNDAVSASLQP